jgi:hypothetical protein
MTNDRPTNRRWGALTKGARMPLPGRDLKSRTRRSPKRSHWPACRRSFLDHRRFSANPLPRALSFGACPVGLRVIRKTGL